MFMLCGPASDASPTSREEIYEYVERALPSSNREDPLFRVGAVLAASIMACGPDEEEIVRLLGYPEPWVRTVGSRLRLGDIWHSEGVHMEGLQEDADESELEFMLLALVGLGKLYRGIDDQGDVYYIADNGPEEAVASMRDSCGI